MQIEAETSEAVKSPNEDNADELVCVVLRDKGIVSPFFYGIVTFSVYKRKDIKSLESDFEIVKILDRDDNGEAEKMCMNTPVQYYLMSCIGASLEDGKVNFSQFKRKIEQVYFMFRFLKGGPNIEYTSTNISNLPPVGVYFIGVISSHVYADMIELDLLRLHVESHFFESNLTKMGF